MLPANLTTRAAAPADFGHVAQMHYPVWRESWAGIVPAHLLDQLGSPRRWAILAYPRLVSRPGWAMWLAESGGHTLGMTLFGPAPDDSGLIQIDSLYVAKHSQRHGIGQRLLEVVLDSNPAADVVLWCAERNAAARRFYEAQNFEADGRTHDWAPAPGVTVAHLGYRLRRR